MLFTPPCGSLVEQQKIPNHNDQSACGGPNLFWLFGIGI
jgi:hypothetical protein